MADKLTPITIIADGIVWMAVMANIDLALRHPKNTGPASEIATEFSRLLREKLVAEGVLTEEENAQILRDQMRFYAHPGGPV